MLTIKDGIGILTDRELSVLLSVNFLLFYILYFDFTELKL